MKLKIAFALFLFLAACSDADTAHRALEAAGYTEIAISGYSFWGCSEDDNFKTGFTAKGPNGALVKGVVCSGLFKGATIRIF
jgi:hypothetical protein